MSNFTDQTDNIEILYEDADCAAINKPPGLMVHGDGRAAGPFLTDWILAKFPETKNVGEPANDVNGKPIPRGGIVHRLDRETSGAILIAKTQKGYDSLKKQFQDHLISKKYLALVWGEVKENFGTINRPIGRSGSDFRKWSAQRGARGELRQAETYWNRLGISNDPKISLLEVEPKTGRTHQIRVHLNAIHHPVVGDTLYAPKRSNIAGLNRVGLHARSVEFTNLKGQKTVVKAPIPVDFTAALNGLGLYDKVL